MSGSGRRSTELAQGLIALVLLAALGGGLYLAGPWLLPVRIVEGPYVQQPGADQTAVIWYTTRPLRPGEAEFVLLSGTQERTLPIEPAGARSRVVLEELEPGGRYPYCVRVGRRKLAEAVLRTAPLPAGSCSFVVLGDSGVGSQAQYALARRIQDVEPDFVLHTGDVVYPAGEREDYRDRFFAPYRNLLAQISFFPALGNHDLACADGQAYYEIFELPENGPSGLPAEMNYWFDFGPARVAVVSSNLNEQVLAASVGPWLREVFRTAPPGWRFVVLHHPPYTASKHRPDEPVRRALVPAFEAARVDVVFCGHNHLYERTRPIRSGTVVPEGQGVVYVVSGAGGAELYPALPPQQTPDYIAVQHDATHSFTHVVLSAEALSLRQIDIDGRVVDEWHLARPALD